MEWSGLFILLLDDGYWLWDYSSPWVPGPSPSGICQVPKCFQGRFTWAEVEFLGSVFTVWDTFDVNIWLSVYRFSFSFLLYLLDSFLVTLIRVVVVVE